MQKHEKTWKIWRKIINVFKNKYSYYFYFKNW
jgi:hypothetical protein